MGALSSEIRIAEGQNTHTTDVMLPVVADFLRENGYRVDTNVGTSGVRMDIAVIDPLNSGYYLAGIRLDGKRYAQSDTARDRNRLMPSVLKVRGWHVFALWILDWYDNPEKEQERLLAYLHQLEKTERPMAEVEVVADLSEETVTKAAEEVQPTPNKTFTSPEPDTMQMPPFNEPLTVQQQEPLRANPVLETQANPAAVAVSKPVAKPFSEPTLKPEPATPTKKDEETEVQPATTAGPIDSESGILRYVKYVHESVLDISVLEDSPKEIVKMMEAIVALEAPIRNIDVFYRVMEAFPGSRLTKNITTSLELCLRKVKKKTTKQGEDIFLWQPNVDLNAYQSYRLPIEGEKRDLETICDYELANLFVDIVKEEQNKQEGSPGLEEKDLLRLATKKLGFARLTDKMATIAQTAVTNAIRRKKLKRDKKLIVLMTEGEK